MHYVVEIPGWMQVFGSTHPFVSNPLGQVMSPEPHTDGQWPEHWYPS